MTGDGSVVVENRNGGSRHLRKVDLSQVQRFASLVRELRYFDFKDRYEVGHVTDLEWATMDVKFGDEAKRINHILVTCTHLAGFGNLKSKWIEYRILSNGRDAI